MPLQLPPDVELIVAEFLRANSDVQALVLDGNTTNRGVYTDLTLAHPAPSRYVRIDQLSGPSSYPHWLGQFRLQLGSWHKGGTKPAAGDVIRTVAAVLPALEGTSSARGAVGAVDVATPRWEPDAVATPATPRWLLDVSVVAHP